MRSAVTCEVFVCLLGKIAIINKAFQPSDYLLNCKLEQILSDIPIRTQTKRVHETYKVICNSGKIYTYLFSYPTSYVSSVQ